MVNYGNAELSIDQNKDIFRAFQVYLKKKNVNVSSIY